MKTRRVMLQLEVQTSAPLSTLRKSAAYPHVYVGVLAAYGLDVIQAQANVVKPLKEGKKSHDRRAIH